MAAGTSLNKQMLKQDAATRKKEGLVVTGLLVLLAVVVLASLTIGRYGVPIPQIGAILWQRFIGAVQPANQEAAVILFVIRIPRIIMAMLVGAALAASGAAYQGLFKNPMVSPDSLGVSSGAGVGAALGILLGMPTAGVQISAFVFGIGAVTLVMFLAKAIGGGGSSLLILVLAGTVISSIFGAFTSLLKYIADTDSKLPEITYWLMGSFARSSSHRNVLFMFGAVVLGAMPLLALRLRMNVLSFGEEEAQAMGVNTKRLRFSIIICSTMLTATTVSMCGTISWVGLIMPHITRLLVGPNYRVLLPASMLSGAVFMVVVDNFCRAIIPGELPVGIVTSLLGAPLFIYMLFKSRRGLE